jgi:hypothetical protein
MGKGRKAQSSAEKPTTIGDIIKDDKLIVNSSAGPAVGKDMKKDLFKILGVVKTT